MLMKKMRRDMRLHLGQFISIFLMAFLAVFIYAGVGSEWRGLQKRVDDFYAATNLADVWVYGGGFSSESADAVLAVGGVTSAERRLELTVTSPIASKPTLTLYFVEKGEVSRPYLAEGAAFRIDDPAGIWLDKRFADANGLSPGDPFTVSYGGTDFTKIIRGTVYSGEQVYESGNDALTPDFGKYGYAYLSDKAFPIPEMLTYGTLLIKTEIDGETEERIGAALGNHFSVYLERKNYPSVSMIANEITQHKMMGAVFPVVFALIALLTMMTTMTRMVTNQRLQIGTLKALGFKKSVVIRHYMGYGFFLSLLGAVCGLVLGPLTLPYLFYPSMSGFYTLPEWAPAFSLEFIAVALGITLLCALVSFLACHRLLRETPADTLRPKAPKIFKHGALEKSRLWGKLGFNTQWNLRDASRNKVRAVMAVVGVFGCTALIVCALGMNDSMKDLKVWQYETVGIYESKLTLGEAATPAQIESVRLSVDGEAILEGRVEIRAYGVKKTGTILVTDNTTLIRPTDMNRQPTVLPADGISVTYKMAQMLGVKAGDTVEWHMYGAEGWTSGEVSAVYRDPVNQGLTLTKAYFEAQGNSYLPTAVLSAQRVSGQFDGVESIARKEDAVKGWNDLTEAMYMMVYLLIFAAAVLAVVVLYNLGLLSFTEMEREMATLKVMGMKTGALRGLLLTQNLWFSAIGFILGIPAGYALIELIVKFSGDSFEFPIAPHFLTLLISFVFTFGLSIAVNLLFSKKIRRIDMVGSLKAPE